MGSAFHILYLRYIGSQNSAPLTAIRGGRVVRRCWVNFQCQGVLLHWVIVGPTALAIGAGGGCLNIFYSRLPFLFFFLSLSGRRLDIDLNTVSKGR